MSANFHPLSDEQWSLVLSLMDATFPPEREIPRSDLRKAWVFPPSPEGGQEVAHGHKGKGTLLHLLIDGMGNPLAITTTAKWR